jgi:tRNA(fMet)-specific endonuclease VapC
MNYLLDTNICIHFLRGKYGMIEKFQEIGTENLSISEVTFAELVFGAENRTNPKKNLELSDVPQWIKT